MVCARCGSQIAEPSAYCEKCGASMSVAGTTTATGPGINAVIPYKNPQALIAYYLGVFSIIPLIGIALGLAGVILGIGGLRYRREHPEAGGVVHAWIGILAGGFFGLVWCGFVLLGILAIMFPPAPT